MLVHFWRQEVQNQGGNKDVVPLKNPGENLPCLFQVLLAPGILGLWLQTSKLCLCLDVAFLPMSPPILL